MKFLRLSTRSRTWVIVLSLGASPSLCAQENSRRPWLFAPADEPHPVVSCFHNVLHTGRASTYFHGGIDIAKPPGTPVLAVARGWVWIDRDGGFDNLLLTEGDGTTWEYRHLALGSVPAEVLAAADRGTPVESGTVLGAVARQWPTGYRHIHLNLRSPDGRILNPLDRLLPLADTRAPTVEAIHFLADGGEVPFTRDGGIAVVAGRVDVAVVAADRMEGTRFSSAPLRFAWRLGKAASWREFDPFPGQLPQPAGHPVHRYPEAAVDTVYLTSGPLASDNPTFSPEGKRWVSVITNVDAAGRPADAGAWDTTQLDDGIYELSVRAEDHVGNRTTSVVRVRTANNPPAPAPKRSIHPVPQTLAFEYAAAYPGTVIEQRFAFRNRTDRAWQIDRVDAPRGAEVLHFDTRVEAGQWGSAVVAFDTTGIRTRQTRHAFGVRGPELSTQLTLAVEIYPALEVRPLAPRLTYDHTIETARGELVLRGPAARQSIRASWDDNRGRRAVRLEKLRDAGPDAVVMQLVVPEASPGKATLRLEGEGIAPRRLPAVVRSRAQ